MKQFTLGNYTLNDFADYLNGGNDYFAGIEGNQLLLTGEHKLNKTLNFNFPITVIGENAVIEGDDCQLAVNVVSSNVILDSLLFKKFPYGIEIDGNGGLVENVSVCNTIIEMKHTGIEIGSAVSNSTLRNIMVDNCNVKVQPEEWGEEALGIIGTPYCITAVRHLHGTKVDNCFAENITINNSRADGPGRGAVNITGTVVARGNYSNFNLASDNTYVKGVNITNNHFDVKWDGTINVMAGYMNATNTGIEDVVVEGNYVEFGISGLYLFASEPIAGESKDVFLRNVKIKNNKFVRKVEDVGEPTRALFIAASRADFVEQFVAENNVIENLEIADNSFDGAGIVMAGAYNFFDAKIVQKNNVVRDVVITNNNFTNADVAFTFDGAQAEARLFDWNFGFPRHDKKWGEEITDHSTVTFTMTNNRIENLTCTGNTVEGYRYRVKASGAWGHGHGVFKDNKVCGKIVFENNKFGTGENHIHVADMIVDDYTRDNGGNSVDKTFKN